MNRSSGACSACIHWDVDPEELPCYDCIDDDRFKSADVEKKRAMMRPRRYLPWCSGTKRRLRSC